MQHKNWMMQRKDWRVCQFKIGVFENPDLGKIRNITKILQGDYSIAVEMVSTIVQCFSLFQVPL